MIQKVAIVTGAGRGIGRAEALALARAGFAVVVNDLGAQLSGGGSDDTVARNVVTEINSAGGKAIAHCGDVGHDGDVETLFEITLGTFGRLDVLVNNAGNVTAERILPDMDIGDLDSIYHVHVRGSFNTSIAATRYWRNEARRTGQRVDARIINTASDAFLFGAPWRLDYAAAKSALVALTIGSAATCSHFGVNVNAIVPRAITRMSGGDRKDDPSGARWRSVLPADPKNEPDSVAAIVVALCGDAGRHVNGQIIGAGNGLLRILSGPSIAAEFVTDGCWEAGQAGAILADYFSEERETYAMPLGPAAALLDSLRPSFDFLK